MMFGCLDVTGVASLFMLLHATRMIAREAFGIVESKLKNNPVLGRQTTTD